ncbi:hypothetical protein B9Z19DRAFT_1061559 [Tuber borchii]|uniref:Uncharacterized protein n=1 Tax=Tuber borchii TaxID=42251 RepID=A0A2T7A553_TUBBO|nr:hypothetical protein B9Z19DRAFT_1061559 [Tuber borchii]
MPSSIIKTSTSLKELSPAATLLVMLSLPSFDALRDICDTPDLHLPSRLLRENLRTVALSIAQNESGPEIWSDMYTLITARTRDLGPPVAGGEVEFGVEEVQIFEETLDALEEWHGIIAPLIISQQQQQQQQQQTRSKSKQARRVLKLSGATPTPTEFIPIYKALLRYWTILIACVPEACFTDHAITWYSGGWREYSSRLAMYAGGSHSVMMEHYLSNFGYVEWAFEVFKGADKDEIRAVWEIGELCAKIGLRHLDEIVETIQISAPGVVESSEAEFLIMEIANMHLKHMARMLGVEVGCEE